MRIPFVRQRNTWSCGPACLQMILGAFGMRISQVSLIRECHSAYAHGTHRTEMTRCLRRRGIAATPNARGTLATLRAALRRGDIAIINYVEPTDDEGHYAIVTAETDSAFLLHDPWNGKNFRVTAAQMRKRWLGHLSDSKRWGWMLVIAAQSSHTATRTTGTRSRR